MEYIALNHNSERAKGIIYNSKKPIGGIYYQDDRKRPVTVERDPLSGRKQAFVEIEKKFKAREEEFLKENRAEIKKIGSRYTDKYEDDIKKRQEIIAEKVAELEDERERFELRLAKQRERAIKRLERRIDREHEKQLKEIAHKKNSRKNYVINIQGQEIDFGKEGIKKADFSASEKDWLAKAQNYFITAKEKGRRIGSAEEYTSMEALEALWSTAQHVGIDPKRFIVQIYNETRFNPNARGAAGERGIGQFKKTTAELYGYDWHTMKSGMQGYAYQAKAAAEFVKKVGEISYNGGGSQARRYQDRINKRVRNIERNSASCVLKNTDLCISKS
jgi:hypothetical protein